MSESDNDNEIDPNGPVPMEFDNWHHCPTNIIDHNEIEVFDSQEKESNDTSEINKILFDSLTEPNKQEIKTNFGTTNFTDKDKEKILEAFLSVYIVAEANENITKWNIIKYYVAFTNQQPQARLNKGSTAARNIKKFLTDSHFTVTNKGAQENFQNCKFKGNPQNINEISAEDLKLIQRVRGWNYCIGSVMQADLEALKTKNYKKYWTAGNKKVEELRTKEQKNMVMLNRENQQEITASQKIDEILKFTKDTNALIILGQHQQAQDEPITEAEQNQIIENQNPELALDIHRDCKTTISALENDNQTLQLQIVQFRRESKKKDDRIVSLNRQLREKDD